jgi:hypothetical protein
VSPLSRSHVDGAATDRYPDGMAKHAKPSNKDESETTLTKLVDHVSPGSVKLTKPTRPVLGRRAIELTVVTRQSWVTFMGDTIGAAAAEALESLTYPGEDPFVGSWAALTRMQRQLVVQTLREHGARHMALAAAAKIGNEPAAYAAFEMADAFIAAVDALDYDDLDDDNPTREALIADAPLKPDPDRAARLRMPSRASTSRA